MSTKNEDWEKEFDELTPDGFTAGNGSYEASQRWLQNNPHLYDDEVYSEPLYTLNKEKVKNYIQTLLTSRDTYWKERVKKEVEGMRKSPFEDGAPTPFEAKGWNQALDTLLDNLK